ncbi:unnamed protein product [Prorocentrum cordatum]|uniref:Uncharacterized protein n=1 Tax=Prorocentrum cordatum TaxID=2364126 RepID=A0ABN9VWF7_9DINO|nr:unnamed protein product [Polarella glacialis]
MMRATPRDYYGLLDSELVVRDLQVPEVSKAWLGEMATMSAALVRIRCPTAPAACSGDEAASAPCLCGPGLADLGLWGLGLPAAPPRQPWGLPALGELQLAAGAPAGGPHAASAREFLCDPSRDPQAWDLPEGVRGLSAAEEVVPQPAEPLQEEEPSWLDGVLAGGALLDLDDELSADAAGLAPLGWAGEGGPRGELCPVQGGEVERGGGVPCVEGDMWSLPALPGLDNLDLGLDAVRQIAQGASGCVEPPCMEDILVVPRIAGCTAAGFSEDSHEDGCAKDLACFSVTGDEPDSVSWSQGFQPRGVSTLEFGVATLPSLWEVEKLADRKLEWTRPSSALFSHADAGPAPLRSGSASGPSSHGRCAAELFRADCWRWSSKSSDAIELEVPRVLTAAALLDEAEPWLRIVDGELVGRGSAFVGTVACSILEGPAPERDLARVLQRAAEPSGRKDSNETPCW